MPIPKCNLPLELRPYWQVWSQLYVDDVEGLLLVGPRVVIPTSLRQEVIQRLLQMHQGATKIRQCARLLVYWPSMDNDVIVSENPAQPAQTACHLIQWSLSFRTLRLPILLSLYSSI